MCGIFSWVGPGIDEARLIQSNNRQSHRGPDAEGHWTDGIAWLGHRRLRIIDLSEAGAQPMFNEDGQVVVVFNGEIYNFPELRAELEAKGHTFRSKSDTEVILHAYEEYGDACVERFWGMFAFAVWDRKRQRMLVARDRFGKKPLNYVHRGENLVLASEIPSILESGISNRVADMEALAFFWQLEFIPAPHSAFSDIKKLPAGHAMSFEDGKLRIWQYYSPRHIAPFTGSYDQAKEQLGELLSDAVRRRLVSDVPLGVALSGGIDSALIVATARKLTNGRLVTVTLRPHLENNEHDEGDFARATARTFGTEHHEILPIPDFRQSFETVIGHLGEPFAISSSVPCYYLFKMLRTLATVVVTGDGGDELFAGYDEYRQFNTIRKIRSFIPPQLFAMASGGLDAAYGALAPLRPHLKALMVGMQIMRGRPWSDAPWEQRRALRPDVLREWRNYSRIEELDNEIRCRFDERDPLRLTMLTEQFNRMTYHILTKVDITSMAHAVETRAPLLDHRIAEFARSLPTDFLIANGMGKRILRDLAANEIPPDVLSKPKSGFGIPIRDLFKKELKPYLLQTLTAAHPVYDALVNRNRIPEIIEAHCEGRPNQTMLLLKLLALRLWIEQTQPRLPN